MINKDLIATKFSQSAFNRFAIVLGAALRAYPGAIEFDPGMKVDSYKQRCRDAITGGQKYGWKHEAVDPDLFDRYGDLLVVSSKDDKIVIGGTEAVKSQKTVPFQPIEKDKPVWFENDYDQENLTKLAQILRAFNPKPRIFIKDLSPETITSFEAAYDIAFVPVEGQPNVHEII